MESKAVVPQPLKRHAALQSYSRDHHFGLLLVWKLRKGCRKGIAAKRMQDYLLCSLQAELLPHFRDEEQFLLTHLPAGDDYANRTWQEHAALEQLAASWTTASATHEDLLRFADLLEAHIRFEERGLFSYLQLQLDAATLQQLEAIDRTAREDVDSQWSDLFWLDNQKK